MKTTKLFLLLAMMFLLSPIYAVPPKTYTRAQVDSIVAVEVQQQLDLAVTIEVQKQLAAKNAEIELLVEKSSQDKLGTYITEQNNQLTRQNTHFTILITVLMAIFGVGAPLLINWQNGKKWNGIAKENESIKSDIETMREQVEKLAEDAEKSKDEARKAEQAAKASELFSKAYNEKNADKKIELYTEVLKISPEDAFAYNNRGVSYYCKGIYDKAEKDYKKAIDIKPDYYLPYYNRSLLYIIKDDLETALEDLIHSIELNSHFDDSRHGLEIVQKMQIIKNLMKNSNLVEAHSIAKDAMEIAKKINYVEDGWMKIMERKIKEIEDLQKQGKP